MALPPLYKYLDVQGAKLTLENGTFKHSKPSDFEDIEDMSIQSIFPEDTEAALARLSTGFTDVILQHLNDVPTCDSRFKQKIEFIQYIYRIKKNAALQVKSVKEKKASKRIFDVNHMRTIAELFISEINEFMQCYRVFCVTTDKDSERMWARYAENHKGIVLRIESNMGKDSKFQLFRPVKYRNVRPPLYDDTLQFIVDSLFGDQNACRIAMLEKIVYAKTLEYEYESEYRLAIPLGEGEKPWNTLKYHPEEITELYLGLVMERSDVDHIVRLAKTINPKIAIFGTRRGADGKLWYELA